jgi:archaemetzincin
MKLLEHLRRDIGIYIGVNVEIMNNMPVPETTYDGVRGQYYSTKILKELINNVPAKTLKILGIIDRDLYIPILTFVFGEAQLGGVGAVVSLVRLRQEYYGLKPDRQLFYERARKECLHELGHTFGLVHCSSIDCLMYFSNSVLDVDKKGREFCMKCGEFLFQQIKQGG